MRTATPLVIILLLSSLTAGASTTISLGILHADYPAPTLHIPASYDPAVPTPLILGLHAYTASAADLEALFDLFPQVDAYGFLYALPEGRTDSDGQKYWDATDHNCDLDEGDDDDDVNYLSDVIAEIRSLYNVDRQRIYVIGHSCGGSMAHRMACSRSDLIAAIISQSGPGFLNPDLCIPSHPVHVMHMHGTADGLADFNGGFWPQGGGSFEYPSAEESALNWVGYDECSVIGRALGSVDLVVGGDAETVVTHYASGCNLGGSVDFAVENAVGHSPTFNASASSFLLDFFYDHPKHTIRFADKDTLTWEPVPWARRYDVIGGSLADLRVDVDSNGFPDSGYGDCLFDPDDTDTMFEVPEVPLPGEGNFYLVGSESLFPPVTQGNIGKATAGPRLLTPCP